MPLATLAPMTRGDLDRRDRSARGAAVVAALSLILVSLPVLYLAGRPLATADLWWHLALGRAYVAEGIPLDADPLTFTAERPPEPHQWLFGVGLHAVEDALGLGALRTVHALTVAGILALVLSVLRRESRSLAGACAGAAVFAVVAWPRLLQLRPDLVSIAAALLLYRLLVESDRPPSWRRVGAACAVGIVWVNAHALFGVGPALLLAALLGCALRAGAHGLVARRDPAEADPGPAEGPRIRRLAIALAAVLATSLANPRGIDQHLAFFASAGSNALWSVRDEWAPFDPTGRAELGLALSPVALVALDAVGLATGLAALWGGLRLLRRPSARVLARVDPVRLGLGLAGIAAILVAVRFGWMVAFPLLFLLRFERGLGSRGSRARDAAFAAIALSLAVAFPLAGGFGRVAPAPESWLRQAYDRERFPAHATEFLRASGLAGRLYNGYAIGGFVGYWTAPRIRTFVDGRLNFPPDVLRDYRAARVGRGALPGETFLELLDRRGFDLFLGTGVPRGRRDAESTLYTTASLARAPGWVLVSRSPRHSVHLRDVPRNRDNLRRVVRYYARERIPFDPHRGLDVSAVVHDHPAWAVAHGMLPPDNERWLRARESDDLSRRAKALDAIAQHRALLGLHAEQLALDRELVALEPEAKQPRRRRVVGLLRLDRPAAAVAAARELVDLDPGDRLSRHFLRVATRYARARAAMGETPTADQAVALDALTSALPLVGPLVEAE